MATDIQKLIGTSEEDEDEEMEMGVKEEGDDDDEEDGEKHVDANFYDYGVDGGMPTRSTPSNSRTSGDPRGGVRRCRPMRGEERTRLRGGSAGAITARILARVSRRHGNYNLRVRADINDVIAALAREAGWVVLPDGNNISCKISGTCLSGKKLGPRPAGVNSAAVSSQMVSPQTPASLKGVTSGYRSSGELNACNMKGHAPGKYNWNGYKRLFQMVCELKLKLQLFDGTCIAAKVFTGGTRQPVMQLN
ncbi:hypothetical protein GBA52_022775 [Prunus armeniaca]|nr:hypothetical protein GBA52_022775 [Prunus armeniaca]